jgi:hypothetical protein
MTKRYIGLMALLVFMTPCLAQNVAINEDGSIPHSKAILDVKSQNKGILIPRMGTTNRLAIKAPQGLLVYDTTTNSFWYSIGLGPDSVAIWKKVSASSGDFLSAAAAATDPWLLGGNTVDSTNFLGTTNAMPLKIRVNNEPAGHVDHVRKNTFLGFQAGNPNVVAADSPATGNTAIGFRALKTNTAGQYNTAIGEASLFFNTKGDFNTASGYGALNKNLTGNENTAAGWAAMNNNTRGSGNTATGVGALMLNVSGHNNTSVGYWSLYKNGHGSNNTAIGYKADVTIDSLTNATAIGYDAKVNASNKVRIGNSAVTAIEGSAPFSVVSDGRFKFEVKEDVKGLDFILQLRPVTYRFDVKRFQTYTGQTANNQANTAGYQIIQAAYNEADAIRRTGFIAQEVEKAAVTSGYNFSGVLRPKTSREHYSLSYESFVVPLVKAVQELSKEVESLKKENSKIADLQQQLDELKQLLKASK